MKKINIPAFVLSAILFCCSITFAQSRPNVDTMSIGGMKTSTPVASLSFLSSYDTLFWNGDLGVGMLRKKGELFGHTGEFRVGVGNSALSQVSFAIGAKNKEDADKIYSDVIGQLHSRYGNPDATITADPPEIRWDGMEQFFAVRMSAEHNAVNIVLSKFDH